ncbi:hypothetical protein [Polaribacter sp. HaHaR_3_91]|uniref:hypothetical protein n=1 Tax=Polaribacter sp. HaHaR_3_91 TaxID=2745561 RepID=UPI001C4F9459|nr:hypothetical protein [Polaribacter sp. HaHaR_3_91]QXP64480.1 polysaccharide pyruvyl transferase family protein [Polaribacter sp. HaHaR_3_91]
MKIYFLVATQHDNLGDLLINKMLIDEISKYGTVYVDAAGVPDSFKKELISKNNVKDFELEYGGSLKRITGYKLLSDVRSEFDFYFKSPGPSGGVGYDYKSIIRTVVLAYQFNYLSKGQMKLNLVGNDIIIKTKLDSWFQRNTNKCFENYLVRSKQNRDELLDLGYKNARFIPDVAFLYDRKNGTNEKKEKVCISFRDLKSEKYKNKIISILTDAIPFYKEKGLIIEFCFQVESDYEFNKFLYEKFKSENVLFKASCLKYNEIPYYNTAKYVLTNRLHVMILGIVHQAIPVLVLNDDLKTSKINRIISDNKLDVLIVNTSEEIKGIDKNYSDIFLNIEQIHLKNNELGVNKVKSLFID